MSVTLSACAAPPTQEGSAASSVAELAGELNTCDGAPYVAAFRSETQTPNASLSTGYPDGYGLDVFGLTSSGEINQITDDARTVSFDLSPDGREVYVVKSPSPIAEHDDPFVTQNRTVDIVAADTGALVTTLSAPDVDTIAIAPSSDEVLLGQNFGSSIFIGSTVEASLDETTASLSIEPGAGLSASEPVWSPDGNSIAYIVESTDQSSSPAQVRVRSVPTGLDTTVYTMEESGGLFDLNYSPDGRRLFVMESQDDRVDSSPRWVGVEIDIAGQSAISNTLMAGGEPEYVTNDLLLDLSGDTMSLYQRVDSGFTQILTTQLAQTVSFPRVARCAR